MLKSKKGQPFYKDFWFWVKLLIFVVFLLFLVFPFYTLVVNSFFSSKADGMTLYNFQRFFQKKYYYQALGNSLKISLIPTLLSVIIGVPMAYLQTRYNIAGKTFWHVLIILSLMCPPFLGAYSWIILFGNAGIVTQFLSSLFGFQMPTIYGQGGICAVFTLKLFPYVYLYVSGAMGSIDRSVEECAENLGSGKLRRLLTVTVPVVMPSIAAGALMVFMTALADYGTPGILAGGDFRTLPTLILAQVCALIFSLGTFAGTVAISIFTFGIVAKMLFESIETIDMGPFEAMEALGANKFQAFWSACVPQILPVYLSHALYCFEMNIRASAILGYVGAGGLGITINERVGWRDYNGLGMVLLTLFVAVVAIEFFSESLRKKLS